MITEDGLEIIDRKKHIVKLAQGEFVSPEHLEIAYVESRYVDQIYIHTDSMKAYLIAVVVPNISCLIADDSSIDVFNLFESEKAKERILESLRKIAVAQQFAPYEIIQGIRIELEPWTPQNGRMTASNKLCRPMLKQYYGPLLSALYDEVDGIRATKVRRT